MVIMVAFLPTERKSNMKNKQKITIDFDSFAFATGHNMATRKQQYSTSSVEICNIFFCWYTGIGMIRA